MSVFPGGDPLPPPVPALMSAPPLVSAPVLMSAHALVSAPAGDSLPPPAAISCAAAVSDFCTLRRDSHKDGVFKRFSASRRGERRLTIEQSCEIVGEGDVSPHLIVYHVLQLRGQTLVKLGLPGISGHLQPMSQLGEA